MEHAKLGHHDHYGIGEKTLSVYCVGFVLCIALTLLPWFAVLYRVAPNAWILTILLVCAVLQFFVQVICFLRLNRRSEQGNMTVISFIFSIIVLFVIIGGSVWIMSSLDYFMMYMQ